MSSRLDLLHRDPYGAPPEADTDGSPQGADRITPHVPGLRDQVLEELRRRGPRGATNPELSAIFCARDVTLWPRMTELQKLGLAISTDRRRRNPETGVRCTVYRATSREEQKRIEEERKAEAARLLKVNQEAYHLADNVLQALQLRGLFLSRDHLACLAQRNIADALRRQGRRMETT
jgi:hypothetical protein